MEIPIAVEVEEPAALTNYLNAENLITMTSSLMKCVASAMEEKRRRCVS